MYLFRWIFPIRHSLVNQNPLVEKVLELTLVYNIVSIVLKSEQKKDSLLAGSARIPATRCSRGCNQTSKKRKKRRPLAAAASPGLGPQKIPPLSGRHSSHTREPSLMFPIEGRVDESLGGRGSLGPKVFSS